MNACFCLLLLRWPRWSPSHTLRQMREESAAAAKGRLSVRESNRDGAEKRNTIEQSPSRPPETSRLSIQKALSRVSSCPQLLHSHCMPHHITR